MCAFAVSSVARATDHPAAAVDALNRGNDRYSKGDQDGAIADYTKAIEIDPRYADAYYNRGVARSDKGDQDGAIADYTKAIEIDPRFAKAYSNRGVARCNQGDQDGAIADFTKAIEIDPRSAKAYYNRGNARFVARDFPGATADLKKALDLDAARDYARFLLFLSEAAGVEGMATARESFKTRRAARGSPMANGSWVETVDRFLGGEIAAEDLAKAAEASPESDRTGNRCEAFFYSGVLVWLRGDHAAAEELLRKCVATGKTTFTEYMAAKAVLSWLK